MTTEPVGEVVTTRQLGQIFGNESAHEFVIVSMND
jgi:hypothetical protein